jgi:predicted amidophosphoribosyltransferase
MNIDPDKTYATRECPGCAMDVPENNNRCPICGYEFPHPSPFKKHVWPWIVLAILTFFIFMTIF